MIFIRAFPNPRIVILNASIMQGFNHQQQIASRLLVMKISRDINILPFLQACVTSQEEVYRIFKKIEVAPLGTHTPCASSDPIMDVSPRCHHYKVKYGLDYSTEKVKTYITYMRPDKDILMLSAFEMMRIYNFGGHISMSNVTHLALSEANINDWRAPLHNPVRVEFRRYQDTLFKLISIHCPALKRITLFLCRSELKMLYPPNPYSEPRFLDIESDFFLHNFSPYKERVLRNITEVESAASTMRDEWKTYMKALNEGEGRDEEALKFWRTREPVLSLWCWFDADLSDEPGRVAQPRLYVPSIEYRTWLPAYDDGSVVHKYKGLAQIFDGAPW
ncbi:hypothetical protein NHQ30_004466 [Ciborinia camelliae]|nr:hypothetical protein NHQ30_004466 [Ciborinia camelliae]